MLKQLGEKSREKKQKAYVIKGKTLWQVFRMHDAHDKLLHGIRSDILTGLPVYGSETILYREFIMQTTSSFDVAVTNQKFIASMDGNIILIISIIDVKQRGYRKIEELEIPDRKS